MVRYGAETNGKRGYWPVRETSLSPARALLLGFPVILFLGALLSDIAFYRSYETQWSNFAAWLIAGALLCGGIVLLLCFIDVFRRRPGRGRSGIVLLLVAAMWILGFINALIHARDGWAVMPTGLILSLIVVLLAVATAVVGLTETRRVEAV